jgi:DNA-binding PadR family transcriptional regulator
MSERRSPTLSPEYALLGFLTQHPAHGYDLHQQLIVNLGQIWHVSLSQTYNILSRLEQQAFISGVVQEQDNLPDRRRFRLTAAGRRRFETWLSGTAGCSVRLIRVEFITRLFFARAIDSETTRAVLDSQIAETRGCLTHLESMLGDLPAEQTFNRLGLQLRIRQLKSVIEWLRECGRALDIDAKS